MENACKLPCTAHRLVKWKLGIKQGWRLLCVLSSQSYGFLVCPAAMPCCNWSCGKNQELQDSAAWESKYRLQALPCRWSATAGLNRLLSSAYVYIVEPVPIAQPENVETFWQNLSNIWWYWAVLPSIGRCTLHVSERTPHLVKGS